MTEEVVKGRDVTIRFDASRCIHSRACVLGHPEVYVPNVQGEWIHPDAAQRRDGDAYRTLLPVGGDPGGAERWLGHIRQAAAGEHGPGPENGPLAFEAELSLRGEAQTTPRATLCRCGQSKNKPFCDGAHTAASFTATGEPAAKEFTALEVRNGPLDMLPLPNGPLQVSGNLEVVSGTGRTVNKVTKTFLCRCGESKNKPYCDGSHKAAGFIAD